MQQKQFSEGSLYYTSLPQEKEKSQINNLTLHLKELEKEKKQNSELAKGKKS